MDAIYLDHAATTPVDPRVREALEPFLSGEFGNPSSRHPLGVRAAEAVDRARRQVARVTGARAEDVTFTSGGTEANNLAVLGAARARRADVAAPRVLLGATEHSSVRASCAALELEGFVVQVLPLDAGGDLDLDAAEGMLGEDVVLVAHMLVNNELGTRYPIEALARLVRARAPHAHLHTDAVQALGKVELALEELGVDSLAVSGHKVHAPKGVGALCCVPGARLQPLQYGGGQEHGRRGGTENVIGVVALGAAADLAERHAAEFAATARAAREALERELATIGARRLTPGRPVDGICAVLLPGAAAEVWMHHLVEQGVATSAGAACQSRRREVSPGLAAVGLDLEQAKRVLRFSFSRMTDPSDLARVGEALRTVHASLTEVAGG